jgi:hypothetical protein
MRRAVDGLALSLVALFLCTCSARLDRNEHQLEILTENGIPVVATTGGPKFEGELFRFEPILQIRENPDQPETLMKNIVRPAYGPDSNYYLLDVNGSRAVVFDPDGTYVRTIGRHGEGPGELQYPTGISFTGGTLNLSQTYPSRLNRFGLSGEFREMVTRTTSISSGLAPSIDVAEDGSVLQFFFDKDRGERFHSTRACVAVSSASGDTIASLVTEWVVTEEMVPMDLGRGTRSSPRRIQYVGMPQIVYSPHHGLVLSTGRTPELACYDLTGRPTKLIRFDLTPEPVTPEDRAALMAEYDRRLADMEQQARSAQYEMSVARTRTFRNNERFADAKSFWGWIQIDEAGWLWLTHPTHQRVDYYAAISSRYRVLNDTGEYIGDSTMPAGRMVAIYHDRVIVEESEPETEERIWAVYRTIPIVEGLKFP